MQVHRQHAGDEGPFLLQWVRDEIGATVFPVHRLDKPTAGLMVFTDSRELASAMGEEFRERRVTKHYQAIVRGHLLGDAVIDYALGPVRDRFSGQSDERRAAKTGYTVLAKSEVASPVGRYESARYTWLSLQPHTGRRHQIRRHLKHIFHPIVGDRKYGDRDHNRFAKSLGFDQLALCSTHIAFPRLDLEYAIEPVPQWLSAATALGLRAAD
jgi:tRNA pseudouridine65 synthase